MTINIETNCGHAVATHSSLKLRTRNLLVVAPFRFPCNPFRIALKSAEPPV